MATPIFNISGGLEGTDYTYVDISNVSTFTFLTPDISYGFILDVSRNVNYVVVGGGGSGAGGAGGGGGGGETVSDTYVFNSNTYYNIYIGSGGNGSSWYENGKPGNPSKIGTSIVAAGGGGGIFSSATAGNFGGSGGGISGGVNGENGTQTGSSYGGGGGAPGQGLDSPIGTQGGNGCYPNTSLPMYGGGGGAVGVPTMGGPGGLSGGGAGGTFNQDRKSVV